VDVQVVVDKSQQGERYTSATFLANMGIPVRVDTRYAIMHNKFIVVDDQSVQTGSFNYTSSAAQRNAENVVVLTGMPQIASSYTREWGRLWDESLTYRAQH
jgi:phosphatidylserine/phosphatidylglycerophosphate/cardiolipin synthase-like enzyme